MQVRSKSILETCIPVWTPQKCAQKTLWVRKVWACYCALKYVSVHLMHFNSSWNSQRRFKTSLIHVKSNSRSTLLKKTCNYDRNILPDPPFLYFFVALKFSSDRKKLQLPLYLVSNELRCSYKVNLSSIKGIRPNSPPMYKDWNVFK